MINVKVENENNNLSESIITTPNELTCSELIIYLQKAKIEISPETNIIINGNYINKLSNEKIKLKDKQKIILKKCEKNEENTTLKSNDPSIPHWRIITKGLNLFGICENPKCKAYLKEVVNNIKEKTYNLIEQNLNMKCPQCNVPVFGSNIGFYDCYYNFYGKKIYNVEENKEEIHSIGKKINNFDKVEIDDNDNIIINNEKYQIYKTDNNIISFFNIDEYSTIIKLIFQIRYID